MNRQLLPIGTVLQSRYRIVRHLGSGGMGAVYEALNMPVSATVALKETFADDEYMRRLFEREAKLLANLSHEAFPRVSDHFHEGSGQYLVMEMIGGSDLEALLRERQSAFECDMVTGWATQILEALEDLHAEGIFHRDIKPANLKLTRRNKIKILDFGIAKGGAVSDLTLTSSSISAATIAFAPLEQIVKARPEWYMTLSMVNEQKINQFMEGGTDGRADLYALAATLYLLLTNRTPEIAPARALAVWTGKGDPLREAKEFNQSIPQAFSDTLTRALAIDREDRFESAEQMLTNLLRPQPSQPPPPPPPKEDKSPVIRSLVSTINNKIIIPFQPIEVPAVHSTGNKSQVLLAEDYIKNAVTMWERGKHDEAIRFCNEALSLNANIPWAYNVRGLAYKAKRQYQEALRDLNRAVELNPNYAEVYYNQGHIFELMGNNNQAIECYSKAISVNPHYANAYYNRGCLCEDKGLIEQSIMDYGKAIENNPNYVDAYYNRGILYKKKGNFDQAIKDYTRAIGLSPNYANAYINRGNAFLEKKDYYNALSDYNRAIALDPVSPKAYNNRGLVYENKGNFDQALHDYTKALELDPNYANAYRNRADLYAKKGDKARAAVDRRQYEYLSKRV